MTYIFDDFIVVNGMSVDDELITYRWPVYEVDVKWMFR
jgi:hypothetical protein